MQEKATEKTIAFTVKTTKFTAKVFIKMLKMFLERGSQPKQGRQSLKDLAGQNAELKNMPIADNGIKTFERTARKYNIDFAIHRDKTTDPPQYMVFFKGRDGDVLTQAFKEYVKESEKRQNRVSLKEKIKQFAQGVGKEQNRERAREYQRDRGQSL